MKEGLISEGERHGKGEAREGEKGEGWSGCQRPGKAHPDQKGAGEVLARKHVTFFGEIK